MNVSVSITEEGISPNIANHPALKAKILVYRRQVLRWFLIYLVLSVHTQMHIIMIYVIWKSKGATIIIRQREMEEWKKSDILECLKTMCLWKLLMLLPLSIYGPNHQSCKLSTIRRMSFLNISPEHGIGVHNNQTWPDLGFLSCSKFDTFNPRER